LIIVDIARGYTFDHYDDVQFIYKSQISVNTNSFAIPKAS